MIESLQYFFNLMRIYFVMVGDGILDNMVCVNIFSGSKHARPDFTTADVL